MRAHPVLFAFLLLGAAPAAAQPAASPPDSSFRVSDIPAGEFLSLREEPDAEAPALAQIPWNARRVRGFGCTNDTPSGRTWCRVRYGGAVGWARRRYLQPD